MFKITSRFAPTGEITKDGSAIMGPNPDFPKHLSLDNEVFFVMPDASNVNGDPEGKFNAGRAQIQSFYTKDKTQGKQAPKLDEIKSISVTSASYPGADPLTAEEEKLQAEGVEVKPKNPRKFDILPEHVLCVYEKVDPNSEENDDE